ncbi:ribonuclease III domain-containing protein [Christensenellaceae bacterium 44-20]
MKDSILEKIEDREAAQKNPIVLAYLGDTVYDLYVRTALVKRFGLHVNELNAKAAGIVNARAQAQASERLAGLFTQQEAEIFKRGRNAKVGSVPKNMEVADYHKATGLEALMGYLFLTGQHERLEQLMGAVLEQE